MEDTYISISDIDTNAKLKVHAFNDNIFRPALLIVSGGAYRFISDDETRRTADFFEKEGFRIFSLQYSVKEYARYPELLREISRAVWEIRRKADIYKINSGNIITVGFSAGAHLISMLAVYWNHPISRIETNIPQGGNRILATVMGYLPTVFDDFSEMTDILPGQKQRLSKDILMTHLHINKCTPPAFLWKTTGDYPVGMISYAEALKKHEIPYEV